MSKVTGLDRLLRRFEELPTEIKDNVRDIVEEVTDTIELQAKRNAPGPNDPIQTQHGIEKFATGISQFIYSEISKNGLTGTIGIEKGATDLAAWIEFGTGISAANYVPQLDPEFQAMAMRYYRNGRGTIIKSPFLLPAWFQHSPTVVPRIIESLKGLKL